MKIIVCVKHIKYIYAQTGTDPKKNFIGPDDIVHLINPLDESAVEEALRIKEKHKESEILVMSLGDRWVEEGLRRCLSMGADKAIHLYVENGDNLDSWTTATIMAHSIRALDFDLIFCGRESIDDQCGLVGPYIAEILKIPYVPGIIKFEMDGVHGKALVHRALEGGNREIMFCKVPALFTVGKGMNLPRYPGLPGILKAEHQRIETLDVKHLELPVDPFDPASSLTEWVSLSPPKPRRKRKSSEEVKLSASDRLKRIVKRSDPKEKEDSKVLEGSSDKVFSEFERVMEENGIVFVK
jgi:electron transfer flavoprotein beta subunit